MMTLVRMVMLAAIVVLLCIAGVAATPAAQEVTVCELNRNPQAYDGKFVKVRGKIVNEFEDFEILDPSCPLQIVPGSHAAMGIWLTFGGDEPEDAIYCCGQHWRKKGIDLVVNGVPVPLLRNDEYHTFRGRLHATRQYRPDGNFCYGCKLYRVTATLTGLFAATDGISKGYGHFGSFHLLTIREVSDVLAERTAVPAGGRFECRNETWTIDGDSGAAQGIAADCASDDKECKKRVFTAAAQHWGDPADIDRGFFDGVLVELYYQDPKHRKGDATDWTSEDLSVGYLVTRDAGNGPVNVMRQACAPLKGFAPRQQTEPFACEKYRRIAAEDPAYWKSDEFIHKGQMQEAYRIMAEVARKILAEGDQSWRFTSDRSAAWEALVRQTKEWNLALSTDLKFEGCNNYGIGVDVWMTCRWSSLDGMNSFSVDLMQQTFPASKQPQWVVNGIGADVCHPDPGPRSRASMAR